MHKAYPKRLDASRRESGGRALFSMNRLPLFLLLLLSATPALSGNTPASADEATEISWKTLRGFNLKTGKMSEALSKLNGKLVKIPGFMVPLDDMEYESVGRFLLVPDPQACIHVPPPPANQMIFVVMKGKKKAPVTWGMPIILTGDLKVKSIRSQFGVVSFQIAGESVRPYTGR